MVFNGRMTDRELIERLGGPAKVAALLGYDKREGGVQRVHNWLSRGIPARVRLQHAWVLDVSAPANPPAEAANAAAF